MQLQSFFSCLLVALPLAASAPSRRASSTSPIVNTTYGEVQGTTDQYRSDVTVFKGIPYAAPPVGSLRWKAPQTASSWSGVLNASTFGPQCAQTTSSAGIFSTGSNVTSEDCLYLNVWTPKNFTSTAKLPVYFWIYGGRFEGGSGDVLTYEGAGLAIKGIVVVTFDYRLGPFGFLAHPELTAESPHNSSGNYGVLDMIAAIKWVHEEISAFGGDPDHITVGGQSAGSSGSLDMMFSPLAANLGIVGIIPESGARGPRDPMTGGLATSYRNFTKAQESGISMLEALNVSTIEEARNLSMTTLLEEDNDDDSLYDDTSFANNSAFSDPPAWRPTLDGYVLTHSYGEALLLGAHQDVNVMTGNNHDESGSSPDPGVTVSTYYSQFEPIMGNLSTEFFQLYPASNDTEANDSWNEFFHDLSRVGTWTWANYWYAGGATKSVYTYFWTHAPPNQTAGAYHGSELWYVFNNIPYADDPDQSPSIWNATDYSIEAIMSSYWANFIKTGNPNGGNLTEYPASSNETATMWLGNSFGKSYISTTDTRIKFMLKWLSYQKQW